MSTPYATAAVEVEADTAKFQQDLARKLARMPAFKVKMAPDLNGFARAVRDAIGGITASIALTADARELLQGLRRDLDRASQDLTADVEVTADTDGLVQEIESTRVPDVEVQVDADTGDVAREIDRLDGEVVQIDVIADTSRAESEVRDVGDAAQRVQVEVTADTSRAEAEIDGIEADPVTVEVDADTEGIDAAGEEAGGGFMASFGASAKAGAAAAVAAAAAITVGVFLKVADTVREQFTEAFSQMMDRQVLEGSLRAALGASDDAAHEAGTVAGHLYTKGVTDSVEEGADAVKQVLRQGLLNFDTTGLGLEGLSTKLQDVATVLEGDVGGAARAVSTILKNQLAGSAQEAMDILIRGQQLNVGIADDLLDTFSEYPVMFHQLGLNASDAMGLLNQGLQKGAKDSDALADGITQFFEKATTEAQGTTDALKAIGIDFDDLSAQVLKGGDSARAGLGKVLDRIRELGPGSQDAVNAVRALFGDPGITQGEAFFNLNLQTAAQSLGDVAGASDKAADALRDNLGTKLQSVARNARTLLGGIFSGDFSGIGEFEASVEDALPALKTAISQAADNLKKAWPDLKETGARVIGSLIDGAKTYGPPLAKAALDLGGQLIEKVAQGVEDAAPKVLSAVFSLGDKIGSSIDQWGPIAAKVVLFFAALPTVIAVAIGAAIVGAVVGLAGKIGEWLAPIGTAVADFFTVTVPGWFSSLGDLLVQGLTAAWTAAASFVTETLPVWFQAVVDFFAALPGRIAYALGALAGMLVSVVIGAVQFLIQAIPAAIDAVLQWFKDLPGRIGSALSSLGSMIASVFESAINFVAVTLPSWGDAVLAWFRALPGRAYNALASLGSSVGDAVSSALSWAGQKASEGIDRIAGFFSGLPGKIGSALSSFGSTIWSGLKAMINQGIDLINKFADGFNDFSPVDIPHIPRLARGAIVTGPTTALIGEAGAEVVIPLTNRQRALQLADLSGLTAMIQRRDGQQPDGGAQVTQTFVIQSQAQDSRLLANLVAARVGSLFGSSVQGAWV